MLCNMMRHVYESSNQKCMPTGDPIIVEDFIYSGTLAILEPYKPAYLTVSGDADGMDPDDLKVKLAEVKSKGGVMPKVMYVNPTGANPTGYNLSLDRRRQIYQICSEHDIIILEDDPYFYLQVRGFLSHFFFIRDELAWVERIPKRLNEARWMQLTYHEFYYTVTGRSI